MQSSVTYFGMIGEKLKRTSEIIQTDSDLSEPHDLKKSFIDRYPELNAMTFKVAVNGVLTNELPSCDVTTIALLPPFAGG